MDSRISPCVSIYKPIIFILKILEKLLDIGIPPRYTIFIVRELVGGEWIKEVLTAYENPTKSKEKCGVRKADWVEADIKRGNDHE